MALLLASFTLASASRQHLVESRRDLRAHVALLNAGSREAGGLSPHPDLYALRVFLTFNDESRITNDRPQLRRGPDRNDDHV